MKSLILLLITVTFFCEGCKKNNPGSNPNNTATTDLLIGKWRISSAYHQIFINAGGTPYQGVLAVQDDMKNYPSCYGYIIHEFRRDTVPLLNTVILDYEVNNAETDCPYYKTDGEPIEFWTFKFAIKSGTQAYWKLLDNNQTLRMTYFPKDGVLEKTVDLQVKELSNTKFTVKSSPVTVTDINGKSYTYTTDYAFHKKL
jgi:hypothetical protein